MAAAAAAGATCSRRFMSRDILTAGCIADYDTTMTPSAMSFRLSDHTRSQIDALVEKMGTTQVQVLAIAVDRLYQQEVAQPAVKVKVKR